jgi:hypothetical protein
MDILKKIDIYIGEGAVPSTEKTVNMKHKTSGKEVVVVSTAVKKYEKMGYILNEMTIKDLKKEVSKFGVDLKNDFVNMTKDMIDKWKANKDIKAMLKDGWKIQKAAEGHRGDKIVVMEKDGKTKWVRIPA